MPALGLGLWQAEDPTELETAIDKALELGYRHFDTAYLYRNEHVLGAALKKWINAGKIRREELFITTKLPMIGNSKEQVDHFFQLSLKALQMDYVDLYLIHCPIGMKYVSDDLLLPRDSEGNCALDMSTDLVAVWKEMEKIVDSGLAKSIGVSNFNAEQLERIIKNARIRPANNQVELNAYFQQKDLVEQCKKNGVTIVAYAPLGSPGRTIYYRKMRGLEFSCPPILEDPLVLNISKKHNKTTSQILLRHLIQLGVAPIPKSTNTDRLAKNIDVFGFELDESDMKQLETLDKGKTGRTFTMAAFPGLDKHPEFSLN